MNGSSVQISLFMNTPHTLGQQQTSQTITSQNYTLQENVLILKVNLM